MRKYRNGLCAIIQEQMEQSVFSRSLFVFTNRRKNIIRFLYWDYTGFAIWTKALDKQKYRWPTKLFGGKDSLNLSPEQITHLLQGMDITCHKALEYEGIF